MRERGVVVSASEGTVDVAIAESIACKTCGACARSAHGARLLEGVLDDSGARVGDQVEVEIPLGAVRAARALVYLLIPGCLLAGYAAGAVAGGLVGVDPDVAGAVAGIAAGAAALSVLARMSPRFERADRRPRVRAVIERRL
ncbi:MAG: SoxR reducing system RseC family protein [Clostridiales bacterium]|nr:SoxR reducing system RseC family protein [Clostridiales bacterium]